MSELPSFYQDLIKTSNAVTVYAIYRYVYNATLINVHVVSYKN
jgi:hypothetical protein